MEDNYVVCINNKDYPDLLKVGGHYHVEEVFNKSEDEYTDEDDKRALREMLRKMPNPYFYLAEIHNQCSCCGERLYVWSGNFRTPKQLTDANLEAIPQITGTESKEENNPSSCSPRA